LSPPAVSPADEARVIKVLAKVMKVINKHNMTITDLIVMYGNLGYHIGASIAGVDPNSGPTLTELEQAYYTNPTIDVSLMIQGLQTTEWEKDFVAKPKLSHLGKREQ
jgi:hypothetical protein